MIHGNIEETLNLSCVEIHCQDPISTGSGNHVGDKLCGDRVTALGLAILTGIAKIGDDCGNTAGRSAAAGVDHNQQLHQMVIDGLAGRLNEKNVSTADSFFQGDGGFAVCKGTNGALSELNTKLIANGLGKGRIGVAAEYLDVVAVCNHLKYTSLISIFGSGHTFSHTSIL